MRFPSGDQSGLPPPLSFHRVNWRRPLPSAFTMKSARLFAGFANGEWWTSNTTCLPSGHHIGLPMSAE
jgi:hypothetical protein